MTSELPEEPAANTAFQADPETGGFVEVTELLHADAGTVTANRVNIEQSTAGTITADHVTVTQSAIKTVDSRETRATQSAALILKSDDTAFHESAAGFVSANRIDLFDSTVGLVFGPVTVAEGAKSRIFVQIGGGANTTPPLLNGESALKLGAGLGLSFVVFSRLLRRLLGN